MWLYDAYMHRLGFSDNLKKAIIHFVSVVLKK